MKARVIDQTAHDRTELHKVLPLEIPYVLYIEPSGYCNLKCKFCPNTKIKYEQKAIMSFNLFKWLIDDIKPHWKLKLIRFCGNGEPLVNSKMKEIAEYAKQSNVSEKIELITNGKLLGLYRELTKYLTRIIISVNDIDDSGLVEDVRKLYENSDDCIIAVKATGNKEMFYGLYGDICHEIYVEKTVPMWPSFETNDPAVSRWDSSEIKRRKSCVQIFKGLQVQANGDVVPCCVDWQRINTLGNVYHMSIREIWDSDKLKQLQIAHLQGKKDELLPCKDCLMNETCDPDNIDDHREEILERMK